MTALRLSLVLLFTLVCCSAALAQTDNNGDNGGIDDECGAIDPNEPCYASGGNYSYCVAKSSEGQQCQDVVTIYTDPNTLCASGCNMCASVSFSAACDCDKDTLKKTGKCTYW